MTRKLISRTHVTHGSKTRIIAILVAVTLVILPLQISAHISDDKPRTFRLVVLPDTQYYNQSYPWILREQTSWIAAYAKSDNTKFVTQLGDVVQDWDDEMQWRSAEASFKVLDGSVPFGIAPGNHDMGSGGISPYFEQYFPSSRFSGLGYGDHGNYDYKNSYQVFHAAGARFVVFNLEFCPPDDVVLWFDGELAKLKDYAAIVATHSFLGSSGKRTTRDDSCKHYDVEGQNSGQDIWNKVINTGRHDNILMILSGHDIWSTVGAARRTDVVNGHLIHQMLSNYQEFENGGGGYMRLLDFDLENESVLVRTYSPVTDDFKTDDANQFTLSLDMNSRFDIPPPGWFKLPKILPKQLHQ